MKLLFVPLIFLFFYANAQKKDSIGTVIYDTSKIELGYLVGYDSISKHYYVQRIYKRDIWSTTTLPCSTVFYWRGDNKKDTGMYWHNDGDPNCVDSLTPCGCLGGGEGYWDKYQGDSVVRHDCTQWDTKIFKIEYFKPAKSKTWKIGEKYELKPNEHFADYKKWYPEPFIYICG